MPDAVTAPARLDRPQRTAPPPELAELVKALARAAAARDNAASREQHRP